MEPKPDSDRERTLALENYVLAADTLDDVKTYKQNFGIEPEGMTQARAEERLAEAQKKCVSLNIAADEITEYVQHRKERIGGIK